MRSYYIDELEPENVKKIEAALGDKGYAGAIDAIYFLPLPDDLLSDVQRAHQAECGPFFLALETGEDWIKLELLVRCKGKIRCSCIAYAEPRQREWLIDYLDGFIRSLDIPV